MGTSLTEILLIAAGVFLGVLLLQLYRVRSRSRIRKMGTELGEITGSHNFQNRLSTTSDDDALSDLGGTVNQLLDVLGQTERQLREKQSMFLQLAEAQSDIIFVHRDEILYANQAAAEILGIEPTALVGMSIYDLMRPAQREKSRENIEKKLASEEVVPCSELQLMKADGQALWLQVTSVPVEFQGEPALMSVGEDISLRILADKVLAESRRQAQLTLDSIGEGVITTDIDGRIDYLNGAASELAGVKPEAVLGRTMGETINLVDESDRRSLGDPARRCLLEQGRVNLGRGALLLATNGGSEHSIELTASPILDSTDHIIGVVVVLHDVTEMRGITQQMSYQASHDALTGLINRREFERRLDESVQGARTGDGQHALCYLDLDGFKAVNDTCGHMAGDSMLREVAGLIKEKVRDSDTVARLGGDEFGMLLVGCPLEKGRQIADDVCYAVKDYRFVWRDKIFNIGVSIGLVEVGHESGETEDLLSAADSACYVAKKQGKGRVHVYSSHDEAVARHRGEIQWLQRLQSALSNDTFELFSQPIVSLDGKAKNGPAFEILLRMRDEDGAEILPGKFMRAAERYQIMPHIDRWVVQTTLAALASESIGLPVGRTCAINISGQTLADEGFLEFVVDCLDRTGVDADKICFEVTESAVVDNLTHAQRFIGVLHGMGCRFALDDFGSDVGSIANLKNLAMDYLKIDGSFIRGLGSDDVSHAMVDAMIKLARTLDFEVVAEQVEDNKSLEVIRSLGFDYVQGFLLGRPQPLQSVA